MERSKRKLYPNYNQAPKIYWGQVIGGLLHPIHMMKGVKDFVIGLLPPPFPAEPFRYQAPLPEASSPKITTGSEGFQEPKGPFMLNREIGMEFGEGEEPMAVTIRRRAQGPDFVQSKAQVADTSTPELQRKAMAKAMRYHP